MSLSAAVPPRRLGPLLAAAVLLFAATLWLDTRRNGFPFFYHPDEPDKVDQLITGKWNFHHPLLMLGAAELAKKILGLPDREQTLVVLGRWCSASFAAAGVLAFALLGWRVRGWAGFWIIGLLLLTQHQVFELAHYFKEDTALFFAMSLAFLALHVHHTRPGPASTLFAGAMCGLCLAAKYLGAVILIPAAVILIAAQRGRRTGAAQWLWFFASFIAVAAAINFPVFTHLDIFTHSFGRETTLVARGEPGYTGGQVPIFDYLRTFVVNTTPMVWILVIAELIAMRKRRDAFDWTMALFPFAFILLLSCSTKTNDRYFLPITAGFYYLAALGAIDLPQLLSAKWAALLSPTLLAALALLNNVFTFPAGLYSYITTFAHDDRTEMLAWIRANVPADAVIAGEDRADLPVPRREERLAVQPLLPQRVIETKYAADLAPTPQALAKQGITYIVICEADYGVFIRKGAAGHLSPEFQRKRAFYDALFKNYQPLWQRPRGTGIYLHPGLQIYHLTAG
ncbi:MAG: glycosyltransferase family 39 protein [Chthoniobacteraceae bacterium]